MNSETVIVGVTWRVTLAAVSWVHPPAYDCNGSGKMRELHAINILTGNFPLGAAVNSR